MDNKLLFRDTILTNNGFNISNQAALGKAQFSLTRAVSTDVDLTGYKIEDLKNLTSLPGEINSGSLVDYDSPKNSVSIINLNFDNSKFRDGYTIRAIGLYGKDNQGNEFLHSIAVSETPVVIPQVTSNVFDGLKHALTIFSGDNKNMTVNLVQNGYATIHYVDDSISKLSDDIQNIIKPSLETKADKTEVAEGMDNLSNQSKQGFESLGGMLKPLLNINEIKQDISNRFVNYDKGLKDKQDNVNLTSNNGRLYYGDTPVLIANAPNQPKLDVSIDHYTGSLAYQITPPILDGGASITGYVVKYKLVTDSDWQTVTIDGNTLYGQIPGLNRGKNYQVKVIAANYAGKSIESDTKQILTATEPIGVQLNILRNGGGIDYEIIVSSDGGLSIMNYQILYKKDNDNSWSVINNANKDGSILENQDGNYSLKARAFNLVGGSDESNTVNSKIYPRKYELFNQNIGYLGTDNTDPSTPSPNVITTHNKPIIDLPKDLKGSFNIAIYISDKYWYESSGTWYTSGTEINTNDILSIRCKPLLASKQNLLNESIFELTNQFKSQDVTSRKHLYVQISNNQIKFYNVNMKNDDINYCDYGNGRNGTFAILQKIEIA